MVTSTDEEGRKVIYIKNSWIYENGDLYKYSPIISESDINIHILKDIEMDSYNSYLKFQKQLKKLGEELNKPSKQIFEFTESDRGYFLKEKQFENLKNYVNNRFESLEKYLKTYIDLKK